MARSLTLSQKALILVAVPLAFEFLFVGTLVVLLQRAESEARKEAHLKAVTGESYIILNNFIKSAMCIYLYKVSHIGAYKTQYEDMTAEIPVRLNSLKIMVQDSPAQEASLKEVLRITNKGTKLMDQAISMVEESDQTGRFMDMKSGIEGVSAELLLEMRKFVKEQQKRDDFNPRDQEQSRLMIQMCIATGLALNVVLAVALAMYFNRNTTLRLSTVVNNTLLMAKGKALSVPLTGTDEIAHLDKTFHDMAKALDEAAKYKQELISVVSHELRTPLTSIQAGLALLSIGKGGDLSAEGKNLISMAEQNTTRLIKLINDLLDVEKMQAGKIDLVQRDIAMESVLDRALNAVAPLVYEREIDIEMSGTKLHAFADEDRLVQVVINLVSNAIKFSPNGSTISVELEEIGAEVEVRVIDHGRGVPPQFHESVFDRFTQVKGTDGKKGSGLGLPICKAIIEGHGGTIGIRSDGQNGSTFWFRVPAVTAAKELNSEEAYSQHHEHS
jgi:signal transduction histidine kinase